MNGWIWICPEENGGIRWYSETLWKELAKHAPKDSRLFVDPNASLNPALMKELVELQPSLIHIQHEYGCFGSKIPWRYTFPKWLRELRKALPKTRIVATAHSVTRNDYRYRLTGRGWQIPFRWLANIFLMPFLTRWWNRSTWGRLDAAIVQQQMYENTVKNTGCPIVREIPLFVPDLKPSGNPPSSSTVLVFGYFSHDKGQDIAIEAAALLPDSVSLVLAGGARRPEDQPYLEYCQALIRRLGLEKRVKITGFISDSGSDSGSDSELDRYYEQATLVLAPFRESTGSGSIVHAFARGKPVLASNLPANHEIVKRVLGSMRFFCSEDAADCALKIKTLLDDPGAREALSNQAKIYAQKYSVGNSIQAHLELYRDVMGR